MARNDSLFRDTADQLRPGTGALDRYGNTGKGADSVVATGVRVGLIPGTSEEASIGTIAQSVNDVRRWDVAVDGRVVVQVGDAFHVPGGDNPGLYRVQVITRGFSRRDPTLCLTLKE